LIVAIETTNNITTHIVETANIGVIECAVVIEWGEVGVVRVVDVHVAIV